MSQWDNQIAKQIYDICLATPIKNKLFDVEHSIKKFNLNDLYYETEVNRTFFCISAEIYSINLLEMHLYEKERLVKLVEPRYNAETMFGAYNFAYKMMKRLIVEIV